MNKIIKSFVSFFIALFLFSCSNDELEKNQENAKVTNTNLELAKFSNLNIAQNVEADFQNVNEIKKDNFKISEFSAKEKIVSSFESDLLQGQLKYQGVTIENEGRSQSYFLEVFALEESAVYPGTITELKDFSGGLNVYSFSGENLGSVVVRNGKATNVSGKDKLDVLTKAINLFYAPSNNTSKIPLCDKTYTQVVELTEDHWRIVYNGTKILSVAYEGQKVTRSTAILPYPCDGSGDVDAIKLQRKAHYERYNENGQYLGPTSNLDGFEVTTKAQYDLLVSNTNHNGTDMTLDVFENNTSQASVKLYVVPWAGVKVTVNEKKVGNNYVVENVISTTFGMSPSFNWEQTNYRLTTNGSTTTIFLDGVWSYVEGTGIVYREVITYGVSFNSRTGKIIEGVRTY
ncbi:hypothetical protein HYN56_19765 [Flavobacterium crocinum]|uniref:DUF5689 domain-containing protein n=1 Tax=Flavobacterium crocinum TaxID=2183896 RepID=A0A2S1YQK8_9FLAO|nr:hypothetical protein [Flavobacterium crocinum]AWK06341.1 hypothetical protein HYN56_19765 [Flavobacterium crocinum]